LSHVKCELFNNRVGVECLVVIRVVHATFPRFAGDKLNVFLIEDRMSSCHQVEAY